MNRILLSIDKLSRFSDVETTFFDIVEYFHHHGWQIDIIARLIDNSYLERYNVLAETGRIQCFTEDNHPLAAEYQLIWIGQGYMSAALITALQKGEISGVYLFHHYHNYADRYLPYGATVENKLAWRSLAVSTDSYTSLALRGLSQRKLQIFPLSVSDAFTQESVLAEQKLAKILLISAEQSDEINSLRGLLAAQDITLDHIGTARTQYDITPQRLADYQLVMGEGRLLVQALSLGIPAYVTDGMNGGGYIDAHSLDDNLDRHFSADVSVSLASAQAWHDDIVLGYDAGTAWARAFRQQALSDWSLSGQLSALLARLPAPAPILIDENEAASLTLHRKVIADDADKPRVLEKWLRARHPSAARIAVMKSFISQLPEVGNIALAIMDPHADGDAVEATLASARQQYWPLTKVHVLSSAEQLASLAAESAASSLLTVDAGTLLMPQATLVFAEHCLRQPEVALWYADSIGGDNLLTADAIFRPDFNPDLLRSQPYTGNQLLINLAAARDSGGLDAQYPRLAVVDLAWRIVETLGTMHIGHIADVLMQTRDAHQAWLMQPSLVDEAAQVTRAHLQRCDLPAEVEVGLHPGLQRVRFVHPQKPLVSVIIPTRDRLPLLRRCIESLMEKTRWSRYELLIVDNASADEDACNYLQQLDDLQLEQIRILRWPTAFNFAALNNFAVSEARGDLLLFLNNDIHVTDGEWMTAMVEHALRQEVAIVGARLDFGDGRLQHAGLATGVGPGVSPLYEGDNAASGGHLLRLQSVHNVSAVSAACMMMRKSVFEELGGFSAKEFPVYLGDVDLALKAREKGYLTVWTPYARLEHMSAATRIQSEKTGVDVFPGAEVFDALRSKWGAILSRDISYNSQLAKVGTQFKLGSRHARYQLPLPGRPLPVMMACHKNVTGCGNYRVIKPFEALEGQLVLEGGLTHGLPSVMEVAEIQPDMLLLELMIEADTAERVRQFRQVSHTKIIMEYDDYFLNVPLKNPNRTRLPKDIAGLFRRSVEQADWLVVSTAPLAEAYSSFHHDIRIAQNRLSLDLWESLLSQRNQSRKPRVGWAGGTSHTGDLEILLPFMKELENEVEWVFMGMKPQGVKCEYHIGVPFEFYPEKLASLNLDLALVPLEINQFNECKSNLRLLELGACGVPVICTDIEPYRCGLPVTLVQNRYKEWMHAIREHLANPGGLAARGDALRAAVHRDWMLRDEGLRDWQHAWLN